MGGGFFTLDDELSSLLFMAHRQIGVLEGMIKYIPDIEIIRELMIMKECYYNKLIDYGGDRLSKMLKAGNMGKNDMQETKNIVAAYEFSFGQNISSITLSKICKIALYGLGSEITVREREDVISLTGAFSNLKEYNPTAPQKILPALADIAAYLLNDEKTDVLAKASLVHYQFEMIHPFQRYNGIVGRIIFPMILYAHGIQSAPFWGLSEFLYFNKNDYFDILSTTQYSGGYIALIKYFVRCIYISAKRASSQIEELVQIITEDESKINAGKTSKITWIVYNYFKRHLVSEIKPISEAFGISYNTVAKIVNGFLEMNILAKDDQQSRHRNFVYSRFMSTLFSLDAQ
jgi:Fic family protein